MNERDTIAAGANDAYACLALACVTTWVLDVPMAIATVRHVAPSGPAVPMAALSAFGPALAALAVAAWRRRVRGVFGRWRAGPLWIAGGLLLFPALQLVATLADVALGGHPARWLHPPESPEHVAAMIVFPLGEELGWRGFAYPRLAARHGPVIGSLILGVAWGVWHVVMWFTPAGPPTVAAVALGALWLALGSVVMAWAFERAGRGLLVAIALHAGAHLDNVFRASDDAVRLRVLRYVVLAFAAALAARALSRRPPVASAGV